MSEYADSFVTMRQTPKILNLKIFRQSSFICLSSSKQCQFFNSASHFRRQKPLAQFNRAASIPICIYKVKCPQFRCESPATLFLNTCQMEGSKSFHFSTTSLDTSNAGSFVLLDEWLSCQQNQTRTSWFQIKTACCCCLANFLSNAAVVGTFSGRKISGFLLGNNRILSRVTHEPLSPLQVSHGFKGSRPHSDPSQLTAVTT